ncbi:MAG: hypothetical protein F6K16_34980 [Symploca sp. SIO2B6]|nr:hypothetical protein [Symploca sp. SIO2B6]
MKQDLIFKRRIEKDFDLPGAIIKVAEYLAEWKDTQPLQYTASPVRKISLTRPDIMNYLGEVEERCNLSDYTSFVLSDHKSRPSIFFLFSENVLSQEQMITVPLLEEDLSDLSRVQSLVDLVGNLGISFEATYGFTPTRQLSNFHGRSLRLYEQEIKKKELSQRKFYLRPVLPDGVEDNLPELLLPSEFDVHSVPDGVWWINYWSYNHVNNIGSQYIKKASWEKMKYLPNGALVLLATPSLLDIYNRKHLDKLKDITDVLRLRSVQDKYRYKA